MFRILKVIAVCIFYHHCCAFQIAETNRTSKFAFGIGLVRFANSLCVSPDGLEGACYTKRECRKFGGTGFGSCANGLGVCCVVQKSCDGTTTSNNTYFTSPNFPSSYGEGTTCSFNIKKLDNDICQARIDFIAFSLDQPNANGVCVNDGLTIIGGASPVPTICGENGGQHIYVNFAERGSIQMNIFTGLSANTRRIWSFKISQIGCDCPTRAPSGCLMYHTSLSGTVRSFNYGTTGNAASSRQLINQNYGVCIAMQPGYCSINWSQTSGDQYSFSVSGNTATSASDGTIGTNAGAIIGALCTNDYVVIPSPTFTDTRTPANVDRFCGNGFEPLSTSSKPFVLTVVTDAMEVGDIGNRGFSLDFSQQRCTGMPF
ncbi:uncharacterized protein LOC123316489 [Coccinella septempunctata]|uniref:uncharacterized protein LOC123316489 n=1 Tax=Coccinella septempunctata TaxID=41139 RepID=UPI001D08FEDB|nr:uncharacterized protein LOC123316489 [Coccinella septempunctata]